MLFKEVPHEFSNFIQRFVEHEMAAIQNMYFCFGQIVLESCNFGNIEHRIILSPDNQRRGLAFA